MTKKKVATHEMLRQKLETYIQLRRQLGPEAAWERMLDGYPARQKARMGPLIEGVSLAEGFRKAQPLFAAMGFEQEIVDVSTPQTDAVIEINRSCMCLIASQACGLDQPIGALCEMDFEATRRAFPDMIVRTLRRQADGACLCIFRYDRPSVQ